MAWRLARALEQLRDEVEAVWPGTTVWTVGDEEHRSRPSDHNPDDGVVSAIDVVGHDQAEALWDFLQKTRDDRVEYMIHTRRKSGSDYDWATLYYGGSSPHNSHIHVSVGRGSDSNLTRPDLYDDPSPWGLDAEENDIVIDKNTDLPVPSNAVTKHQNALEAWREGILPEYGADGDFGTETEDGVKAYQRAADLPVTGRIDGVTSALLLEWLRDRAAGAVLTRGQADRRYERKGHGHKAEVTLS